MISGTLPETTMIPEPGQTFQQMYERYLVAPLFEPWVDKILDEIHLEPGESILDVACGTGVVARRARDRTGPAGKVVGVDKSPQMLEVARGKSTDVDWREGDAAALPIAEGESFDAVVCQQGFQFFPEKAAALSEMRRALGSGGRLAIATWASEADIPFVRELHEAAERHLGAFGDSRHSCGDPVLLERLLGDAGLRGVRVRRLSRVIRLDNPDPFLFLNAQAFLGMARKPDEISGAERERLVSEVMSESSGVASRYRTAEGVEFEMSAILATGTV